MDKLAIYRVLKSFSDGNISWRNAVSDLEIDTYTELCALLEQHQLPYPAFPEEINREAADIFVDLLKEEQ